MVQIAVTEEHFQQAKEIINTFFKEIRIETTENARETIGSSMSIIYIKCFPVKKIGYSEYEVEGNDIIEAIKVRIADDETERQAMKYATNEDTMFIPSTIS